MDRIFLVLVLAGCLCQTTESTFACNSVSGFPTEVCHTVGCTDAIKEHIQHEFNAAFKYMHMGSYFAQDKIDRPGLAKYLLEAASEERGHAIQMLDYLNLRGIKLDHTLDYSFDTSNLVDYSFSTKLVESDLRYKDAHGNFSATAYKVAREKEMETAIRTAYKDALETALIMEIKVTNLIYNVVNTCKEDFHGADVFTNPFLDEQYNGVRKLQGAVKAFNNLLRGYSDSNGGNLAEYIFDHKMLRGEF